MPKFVKEVKLDGPFFAETEVGSTKVFHFGSQVGTCRLQVHPKLQEVMLEGYNEQTIGLSLDALYALQATLDRTIKYMEERASDQKQAPATEIADLSN